jgi:N4-gp56 family major capsid protein
VAKTNFAALTDNQKKVWQRDVWHTARQKSFIMSASGSDINSVFQRITELTPTERGDQAVITLVPDLELDGVMGDSQLWDNEEAINALDQTIYIDMIRHANRTTGKMADQRSIVKFRETSKDVLAYWLADRTDQMGILTLSGVDPRLHTNGSLRTGFAFDVNTGTPLTWASVTRSASSGQALIDLAYFSSTVNAAMLSAGDRVKAPSTNRWFRWNAATGSLASASTTSIVATDLPSYRMLVEAKAYAKDRRLRPISGDNGRELFYVLMHPKAIAKLKLDPDFLANLRQAGPRDSTNPLISGAIQTMDGLVIIENTHVYNTMGAILGSTSATASASGADTAASFAGAIGHKWGANADVNGSRTLILGAQALAYVDFGNPEWEEDDWDYKNQLGISVGKIMGFMKPQWYSPMDNEIANISTAQEDYGVLSLDHAI